MSSGKKLPVGQVYPTAVKLRDLLGMACERIEFAGSLRRAGGEAAVLIGDLELVAVPQPLRLRFGVPADRQKNALESLLADLVGQQAIRRWPVDLAKQAWGERYKKFWIPVAGEWFQVDLFIADQDNFGSIFTIRTGPAMFMQAFMAQINRVGIYQQTEGYLTSIQSGEIVPVPSERDYFARAGVKWVEPEKRIGPESVKPIRERSAANAKALTVWQPWASLLAAGVKEYETRSWSTRYRGLIAIHAAKRQPDTDYRRLIGGRGNMPDPLPVGAVVALARLVDVVPTDTLRAKPGFMASQEARLGDYAPGRFAWQMKIVEQYDPPLPAQGKQGLWDWTPVEQQGSRQDANQGGAQPAQMSLF